MSDTSTLDAEELKFLAIEASRQNQTSNALLYLKEAIAKAPQQGDIHYLLGAEYAQLGMYDRAAQEMDRALHLSPELHTARLQLGMLHLGAARVEDATRVLQPLSQLGLDHPLYHMGEGLQHLMHDRFPECRAAIERGMALNTGNPALNGDMQKLLDALPASAPSQSPAEPRAQGGNVWLSAYRKDEGAH